MGSTKGQRVGARPPEVEAAYRLIGQHAAPNIPHEAKVRGGSHLNTDPKIRAHRNKVLRAASHAGRLESFKTTPLPPGYRLLVGNHRNNQTGRTWTVVELECRDKLGNLTRYRVSRRRMQINEAGLAAYDRAAWRDCNPTEFAALETIVRKFFRHFA